MAGMIFGDIPLFDAILQQTALLEISLNGKT